MLSTRLGVSDSYLKKTLRKLVVAGLVESSANRNGGFRLARPIDTITLADAYVALEADEIVFRASPLAEAVFPDKTHTAQSVQAIEAVFQNGYEAFLDTLSQHPLSELLEDGSWEDGIIDWKEKEKA